METLSKTDKFWTILFLAIAFFVYLSFGLYHLTKFETADERYWMYEDPENGRINAYWEAIGKAKWNDTYINDKPGVSLAYVSGVALLIEDKPAENLFSKNSSQRDYAPQEFERVHFLFRLPLLIFNGLFCLALFWFIWKFTRNHWIALWATMFMLLSPILLGISQIVNPDSLLWTFSAGAIFAYLSYLRVKEKKYLVFASIFLAFALLSKYSAIILIPFFLVVLIVDILFQYAKGQKLTGREIGKMFGAYLALVLGALAVFSVLLPAVFTQTRYMFQVFVKLNGFQNIIIAIAFALLLFFVDVVFFQGKILSWLMVKLKFLADFAPRVVALIFLVLFLFVLYHWISDTTYAEGIMREVPFDTEKGGAFQEQSLFVKTILEFVPLLFSLTPLTLLALLFMLGKAILKKTAHSKTVLFLLIFLAAFYAAMLLQNLLVTIRYGIMLYPLVLLLASLGIWELFSWKRLEKINKIWITVAILVVSFWSLWSTKPFYFNYTSDLLPQNRIITDAWGYGGYEAAQYLNNLPNAENLLVWSDYNGYCYFLKGDCIMGKNNGKFRLREGEPIPDYFIKTRRGTIMYRGMWNTINDKFLDNKGEPVWEFNINGRAKNYIKIFKYVPEKNE
jgi:4-amino-4-deoxy-L-arabinose transferase-like glycosyltransferase